MTITLRRCWHDYLTARELKETTKKNYANLLNHCVPDWWDLEMSSINKDMIEARHKSLGNTPAQANYLMRVVKALFNYATYKYDTDNGAPVIKNNPTKRLSELRLWNKVKPRKGHIPRHQIQNWYSAVLMMRNQTVRDILIVLVLTGLRISECLGLRWENVDLQTGVLTVKNTKNGSDHTLPLPDVLWGLLATRYKEKVNEFVFPGGSQAGNFTQPYAEIRKLRLSLGFHFTPHDLRRTFVHIAKIAGVDPVTRKQLVNHSFQDVTGKHYLVEDPEELREAMQITADKFMELAGFCAPSH